MAIEFIQKKRLDSLFSILNRLPAAELPGLAQDYEKLEAGMIQMLPHICDDDPFKKQLRNMIVDVADRTDMIYRFIRNAGHGDSAC